MYVIHFLAPSWRSVQKIDEKSARQTGRDITCVWCRSSWGVAAPTKPAGSAIQRGGFINLAGAIPEIDTRRDTSTCKRTVSPYFMNGVLNSLQTTMGLVVASAITGMTCTMISDRCICTPIYMWSAPLCNAWSYWFHLTSCHGKRILDNPFWTSNSPRWIRKMAKNLFFPHLQCPRWTRNCGNIQYTGLTMVC